MLVWGSSAFKHGVTEEEMLHAIKHHEVWAEVAGRTGDETRIYIGKRHEYSDEYLEVLVAKKKNGDFQIFHAMQLTEKFSYLLSED